MKELTVTYDGTNVMVEFQNVRITLSGKQALFLSKFIKDFDRLYNLGGRRISLNEWDFIHESVARCKQLSRGKSEALKMDKDMEFAFRQYLPPREYNFQRIGEFVIVKKIRP